MALNATTYTDMVLRGRAASSVPYEAAVRLAEMLGIDLPLRACHRSGL